MPGALDHFKKDDVVWVDGNIFVECRKLARRRIS